MTTKLTPHTTATTNARMTWRRGIVVIMIPVTVAPNLLTL
jgi:hypothetical protein